MQSFTQRFSAYSVVLYIAYVFIPSIVGSDKLQLESRLPRGRLTETSLPIYAILSINNTSTVSKTYLGTTGIEKKVVPETEEKKGLFRC